MVVKLDRITKVKWIFPNISNYLQIKLKFDEIQLYSATNQIISQKLVNHIIKFIGSNNFIITEACAGAGADTITLSNVLRKINSIELSIIRYNNIKHNLKILNINNVNLINGDCLKIIPKLKQDIIYIDAPWSTTNKDDYDKDNKLIDLYIGNTNLYNVVNILGKYTKYFALKVPTNFNYINFIKNCNYKLTEIHSDLGKIHLILIKVMK